MSGDRAIRIGSAIFNADHGYLADIVLELHRAGIDFYHWDVFDGHFIPELGFPPQTLRAVRALTDRPFEVHLATEDALRFIKPLVEAGANLIFIPTESTPLLYETVLEVNESDLKSGVSLAVGTPVSRIEGVLPYVDSVLVLGRVYGEAATKSQYLPQAVEKVKHLRAIQQEKDWEFEIQAAGSLDPDTVLEVIAAGADAVVLGAALHKSDDLTKRLSELQRLLQE